MGGDAAPRTPGLGELRKGFRRVALFMTTELSIGLHEADVGNGKGVETATIEKEKIGRPWADAFDGEEFGAGLIDLSMVDTCEVQRACIDGGGNGFKVADLGARQAATSQRVFARAKHRGGRDLAKFCFDAAPDRSGGLGRDLLEGDHAGDSVVAGRAVAPVGQAGDREGGGESRIAGHELIAGLLECRF